MWWLAWHHRSFRPPTAKQQGQSLPPPMIHTGTPDIKACTFNVHSSHSSIFGFTTFFQNVPSEVYALWEYYDVMTRTFRKELNTYVLCISTHLGRDIPASCPPWKVSMMDLILKSLTCSSIDRAPPFTKTRTTGPRTLMHSEATQLKFFEWHLECTYPYCCCCCCFHVHVCYDALIARNVLVFIYNGSGWISDPLSSQIGNIPILILAHVGKRKNEERKYK